LLESIDLQCKLDPVHYPEMMRRAEEDIRVEQIAGIQSTKVMRTGTTSYGASGGGEAWDERVAASMRRK
jgi:hypothetical protein